MSKKQFKKYRVLTVTDGELNLAGYYTYDAALTEKQVKARLSAKLVRHPDSIVLDESATTVELY